MATENKTFRLSNPLKKSPNSKTNFRNENEVIKELKEKGLIKDFVLGAKYCLPTNKLNYDKITQIKNLFGEGEEETNRPYRSLSMSESGWLAVSIASDKAETIESALEKYREFAKDDKDLFISGYGEIEFTIDFSKFGMFMDPETGNIYYPYGAFFFSDNKTLVNQFSASVACIPQRYQKIKNKRCISPIDSVDTSMWIGGTSSQQVTISSALQPSSMGSDITVFDKNGYKWSNNSINFVFCRKIIF